MRQVLHPIKNIALAAVVVLLASPAAAQIDAPLSAYLQQNAKGYLQPLVDAFAADVNSGLFHSARIPSNPHLSFELKVMSVFFEDADRTFVASTEGLFTPAHRPPKGARLDRHQAGSGR